MPNILDVAKAAGVSTATVSRVLNTPEKVSPKMKKRVSEAVRRLGYNPNENRSVSSCSYTRTVLVIIPDFNNMFLSEILSGINEAALKHGYSLLLAATNSFVERERELVKLLNKRQADGVIFLSSLLSDQELDSIAASYPLVQCCEYSGTSTLPHVSVDNYTAFREATEFLIKIGHRDIAMLSSTNHYFSTMQREAAYKSVLNRYGIEVLPGRLRRGTYSFLSGYENMQAILKYTAIRPTAVLAIADTVAAGAMRAIHEAGLRIPEDIAVMGIDNLDLCSMLTPTLTTIAQPRNCLGTTAIEMILRQIAGDTNRQSLYLPHELIVRGST